ncbi:hypothetical protein E8E14_000230 [Neopestalotiopsis sp. 37M]|nr:hypothetical protein E8E14_000230 [Neopestalotiopsis sp. 37M]
MWFVLGTTLMSICLIVAAILQKVLETKSNAGLVAGGIIAIFLFQLPAMACWQVLTYQYPVEILKYSQRARGLSLCQAVGFAFSFLYTYTFPIALEAISWRYFLINVRWNFGMVLVMLVFLVETKGKTLEESDEIFDCVLHLRTERSQVHEGVPLEETRTNQSAASMPLSKVKE